MTKWGGNCQEIDTYHKNWVLDISLHTLQKLGPLFNQVDSYKKSKSDWLFIVIKP